MELTVFIGARTLFAKQVEIGLETLGTQFGYIINRQPRWDEVAFIWKPITWGIEYKLMSNLKSFNNFITTELTLTEKAPLLETGLRAMGDKFFEIHPPTAVAPAIPVFSITEGLGRRGWIVKPSAGWGGRNIEVFWDVQTLRQIPIDPEKPKIIQKYIENPLLFRRKKFDIRVHILLTNNQVFYHDDCYVRVAPEKYSTSGKSNAVHLTNIMLHGQDGNLFLLHEILETGVTMPLIISFLEQLRPLFQMAQRIEAEVRDRDNVTFDTFELLGLDIMFDNTIHPWLLEINKDPAFKSEGFYKEMGPRLINDTLKEALFFKWNPDLRTPTGFHPL